MYLAHRNRSRSSVGRSSILHWSHILLFAMLGRYCTRSKKQQKQEFFKGTKSRNKTQKKQQNYNFWSTQILSLKYVYAAPHTINNYYARIKQTFLLLQATADGTLWVKSTVKMHKHTDCSITSPKSKVAKMVTFCIRQILINSNKNFVQWLTYGSKTKWSVFGGDLDYILDCQEFITAKRQLLVT